MIVFTAAIMDLCHEGHINLLERMRERAGDQHVAVVLHSDEACYRIKGKFPVWSTIRRASAVRATGLVDEVLITGLTDPTDKFLQLAERDDVLYFMRGDDNLNPPGRWFLDHYGIPQEYINYTEGVSSTRLREWLR